MFEKLKYIFSYCSVFGFNDKETNKKFYDWRQEYSYKQITYIAAVTGMMYILLSFINRFTAPESISYLSSNLQLFLVAPFIFLVSYLAYKKKSFILVETLLFIAPLYAANIHVYIISKLDYYNSFQTELYLMIFWIYTISGLRFIDSIITSSIVFFIGTIGAYLLYPNQQDQFILHTAWMSVSMIFGFVGGYLLQESQKNTFTKQMELEKSATLDKLTGLYNRVKLEEILTLELERASRYNNNLGIIIFDIDFFKRVNDEHGHLVGDKVLVKISDQVKTKLRSSDLMFRWGGEEFIIICLEVDKAEILNIAEKVRECVEEIECEEVAKNTISLGTTISEAYDDVNSIIKRADDALYNAKNCGRNCIKYS